MAKTTTKTTTKTSKRGKKTTTKKGATKATTKRRTKVKVAAEAPVAETPVETQVTEEPVKVVESTAETPVESTPETSLAAESSELRPEDALSNQLMGLLNTVSGLMTQLKSVQSEVKLVQKNYTKLVKEHDKTVNKRKRQYRKPSGFAKPSPLSEEMTQFLGLEKDVEIARNEVTKLINNYIVENNLRNAEDKRKILPDAKLSKLLNLSGDENLSYFNLQKYIKHHFVKSEPVA